VPTSRSAGSAVLAALPDVDVAPRRLRGDDGASALELSIVAPAILALIFFAIQAGLFFYGRTVAVQAAREGVSQLRLAQTSQIAANIEDDVEDGIESYALALGREALLNPQATGTYDEDAGTVSMTVTGTTITLVPGLTLTATGAANGEIERFEADPLAGVP
jgi:Flp pilus assembly protein TadG